MQVATLHIVSCQGKGHSYHDLAMLECQLISTRFRAASDEHCHSGQVLISQAEVRPVSGLAGLFYHVHAFVCLPSSFSFGSSPVSSLSSSPGRGIFRRNLRLWHLTDVGELALHPSLDPSLSPDCLHCLPSISPFPSLHSLHSLIAPLPYCMSLVVRQPSACRKWSLNTVWRNEAGATLFTY